MCEPDVALAAHTIGKARHSIFAYSGRMLEIASDSEKKMTSLYYSKPQRWRACMAFRTKQRMEKDLFRQTG